MAIDYEKVRRVLEEFNEIHGAECEVLSVDDDEIDVLFKGHICFTCGTYDYFEDLAMKLSEALGKEYVPAEYHHNEDGTYIVIYKPKEKVRERKREALVLIFDEKGNLAESLRIDLSDLKRESN